MKQFYSALLLNNYPETSGNNQNPLPGLAWKYKKNDAGIYTIFHDLNLNPAKIKLHFLPLESGLTVTAANIEPNSFAVSAQRSGDNINADFLFVLEYEVSPPMAPVAR